MAARIDPAWLVYVAIRPALTSGSVIQEMLGGAGGGVCAYLTFLL